MDSFLHDEAVLLRWASTFNWTPLLERCVLIKEIFSLSANSDRHDDSKHATRVAAASRQLLAMDEWQNTVLHMSCFHSAPIEVIRSLLEAASASNPPIPITSFLTGDNSTPLLIACATGASTETIQALLDPPPGSDHHMIRGGVQSGYPDDQSATPLSELYKRFKRNTQRPIGSGRSIQLGADFWTNVEAIVRAGWQVDQDIHATGQEAASMLHSVANMAESCPIELTDLILQRYPDTTCVLDGRGMLPLHVALCFPSSHSHSKLKQQRAYMIHRLLVLHPEAARIAFPEKNPRTPFCSAIAAGLDWHVLADDSSVTSSRSSHANVSGGPLRILWTHEPQALRSRDMQTGLFPFLLAATVESTASNGDGEVSKLNNIYNMLRLHPEVIQDLSSAVGQ